jgi:hypothetical protein
MPLPEELIIARLDDLPLKRHAHMLAESEEGVARARGKFDRLRLRGEEALAARLYESLGFRACSGIPNCTHVLESSRR